MVGGNVVLTDTADVLPLLRINYETNLSPAAVRLARGVRGVRGEARAGGTRTRTHTHTHTHTNRSAKGRSLGGCGHLFQCLRAGAVEMLLLEAPLAFRICDTHSHSPTQ